jgi:hypothetical protein
MASPIAQRRSDALGTLDELVDQRQHQRHTWRSLLVTPLLIGQIERAIGPHESLRVELSLGCVRRPAQPVVLQRGKYVLELHEDAGDGALIFTVGTGQGAGHGRPRRRRAFDDREGFAVSHAEDQSSTCSSPPPLSAAACPYAASNLTACARRRPPSLATCQRSPRPGPGPRRSPASRRADGSAPVAPADAVARRLQIKRADWAEFTPAFVGSLADVRLGRRGHHCPRPAGHRSDYLSASASATPPRRCSVPGWPRSRCVMCI